MKVVVSRKKDDGKMCLGTLEVFDCSGQSLLRGVTLELSWNSNLKGKSSIPCGWYNVVKRKNRKFGMHFHIFNTPSRSLILIHAGNFSLQKQGCILVGENTSDINSDGIMDITASKKFLKKMLSILPNEFSLEINNSNIVWK